MKLRGALIGCGQVSQHQLRAWAQIDEAEIVALYNRTIKKAEQRAIEFGVSLDHVYGDYNDLFDKEELDFVDIATAPEVHREHVEAAAAHGYNVLCQKPFAPTVEDARAMIAACDKAGVLFSINENWRWRAWYRELKKLLESRIIGQIRYISIVKHRNNTMPGIDGSPPPLTAEPHTKDMERLIVYSWGTHLIDLVRFLIGDVTSIYAQMGYVSPYFKGDDRALITLKMKEVMGIIDISWASVAPGLGSSNIDVWPENITIEGDRGAIKLVDSDYIIRVIVNGNTIEHPTFSGSSIDAYQESYTNAQRHFIECLLSGQLPETFARDYLNTLEITLAAYDSMSGNRAISFE